MSGSVREAFGQLFDVGKDILIAYVDQATNVILAQFGDAMNDVADSDTAEVWGPPGYYAIPANPTKATGSTIAGACQALVLKGSDRDRAFATRDVRDSSVYGNLKPGERCIAAGYPSQGRVLFKANGAVVAYTTSDNTPSGKSVSAYVGPDKIQLSNPFGAITIDSTGITMTAGQAGLQLLATGDAKLIGQTATVSGSVAAIAGQVMTMIGPKATPATPIAIQAPGSPGATSLPSLTVFGSP
jgi:hypothetical protein